jgi:hypothetical protein
MDSNLGDDPADPQTAGGTPAAADDDPLVANPTWSGSSAAGANVQDFFNSDEIRCMNSQGIDLSTYESVRKHATDIWEQTKAQNMPAGGPPWSGNRVQTFRNWIDTGFPETPVTGTADDPVIAHPTYLQDIRHFFREEDIGCMKPRGIDLSTYAGVRAHATNIYLQTRSGRMPEGGPRWSANRVQTFLNWMNDKYPVGASTGSPGGDQSAPAADVRLRVNVTTLSDPEKERLKKAFRGIMALDPTPANPAVNPNSYFAIAGLHGLPQQYCMHHVDPYNPWHRLYVTQFENALRTIEGCEDITLPYWDINEPPPPILYEEPFASYSLPIGIGDDSDYPPGYAATHDPSSDIWAQLNNTPTVASLIGDALPASQWGGFTTGGYQQPIMEAHDDGHGSCGATMNAQEVAAFDPIFWFFHCNWERMFQSWQSRHGANTVPGFSATLDGNTDWLGLELDPYPQSTNDVIAYPQVIYDKLDLDTAPVAANVTGHVEARRAFAIEPSGRISVRVKDIDRMNIPGTFVVRLLADGEPIARRTFFQPKAPRECTTCRKKSLVSIDFRLDQQLLVGRKLSVAIEVPSLGEGEKGRFPLSSAGSPTINARLLLQGE